jgi:hypothetical protein
MDTGNGQYKADTAAAPKPGATKAAEYGSSGAVPSRPKSGKIRDVKANLCSIRRDA